MNCSPPASDGVALGLFANHLDQSIASVDLHLDTPSRLPAQRVSSQMEKDT